MGRVHEDAWKTANCCDCCVVIVSVFRYGVKI